MPALDWRNRARPSDEMPEPPFKKRKMTTHDHTEEQFRIVFNKTIAGKYRDGDFWYEDVGVLLITWEEDDLFCKRKEIPRLHSIFEDQFGYNVERFSIPSDRSSTALARKLADFAWRYDSPNKMGIVYYGGHGQYVHGRLKLFAKKEGNGDGDPTTFFDDAVFQLRLPDTDILVILDCCFAARAFSRVEIGRRKFELLTSVPALELARPPDHDKSFTKIVCDNLEKLVQQCPNGFTTAKLYRLVYHQVQEDHRKPLLFDQSPVDYGKILLMPFKRKTGLADQGSRVETPGPDAVKEPQYYIDLSLKVSTVPTPLMMNALASSMSYLPHVTELKFRHLRAPEEALRGFMNTLLQIKAIRPLIAKLRRRIAERKRREMCQDADNCHSHSDCGHCPQHLHSPLHKKRKVSEMYDWNGSELEEIVEVQESIKSSTVTSLEPRMPDTVDTLMESLEPNGLASEAGDPET